MGEKNWKFFISCWVLFHFPHFSKNVTKFSDCYSFKLGQSYEYESCRAWACACLGSRPWFQRSQLVAIWLPDHPIPVGQHQIPQFTTKLCVLRDLCGFTIVSSLSMNNNPASSGMSQECRLKFITHFIISEILSWICYCFKQTFHETMLHISTEMFFEYKVLTETVIDSVYRVYHFQTHEGIHCFVICAKWK